jgi:hypothetical protein
LTALAKKPGERFQSAAAMANALERAAAELPATQWRELSARRAPLSRGSAPRVRPPTTAPPPMTIANRDTPPAMSAVNVPRAAKKRSRRTPILIAVGMCVTGIAGAIIATIANRSEPPVQVARRDETTPPPVVVDAPALADAAIVVELDAAEAPKPKRKLPRPAPAPTPAAPASTAADQQRAKIADEYKMHHDHVALPGEVPIKRRPRMSRGKYDPKNFDYRAFMPQAIKLARAEFADAQLMTFEVKGTTPDGRANIAIEHGSAQFRFATSTPVDEGCVVTIDVFPTKIETYVENGACGEGVAPPRCTFARVWEKMLALGTNAEHATLSYNKNGWVFSGIDRTWSLPDDCK